MPELNLNFFSNHCNVNIKLKSAEITESKKLEISNIKVQSAIERINFKKSEIGSNIVAFIDSVKEDSSNEAEFDLIKPPPDFLSVSKLSKGRELLEKLLNTPSLQEEIPFVNTKNHLLIDQVLDEQKKQTINLQIEAIPKKFYEDSFNQYFSVEGEEIYSPLSIKKIKQTPFYENLQPLIKNLQIDTLFIFYQILLYRYGSAGFFNLSLLLNMISLEDLKECIEKQKGVKAQIEKVHIDIRDDLGGRVHLKYQIRYSLILQNDLKETLKACRELMIPRSELVKAWKGTSHLPLVELKDAIF